MPEHFKYLLFAFLHVVLGAPVDEVLSVEKRDNFVWGSLGESWAAGVSYSTTQHTDYDNDKNGCHRWKDSYGPLMEADTTWTISPQQYHFAACSAARLVHIVAGAQGDNPPQMDLVGNPQMLTYHAGGNNCNFGSLVADCIYQPTGDFGPEYPDPDGKCAKRIAMSNEYIDQDDGKGGLYFDEMATIRDLLGYAAVKDNKDFKLYILGYARFFNLGDNYCNDISFGALAPVGGNAPKVSNRLRTDINNGINRVNNILARVARDVEDSRVKFIDISPAFDGHRFCEDHHNYKDQWYNKDVWLWNLNTPADDPPAPTSLIDMWLHNSSLPDGKPYVPDDTVAIEGSGGSTGDGPTWQQRPFHPKQGGTGAIKDLVIGTAKLDKVPGVIGVVGNKVSVCDGQPQCQGSDWWDEAITGEV